MFIVFEGIDGCGKTTQAALLADYLAKSGYLVHLTAEPTKSRLGLYIREALGGKEKLLPETLALLFTADRYEHLTNEILPALDAGKIVICERYYYSTIAYQTAQGVDRNWLFELNKFAIKPDLVIFLDINRDIAMKRKEGKDIFEEKEFLKKIDNQYIQFPEMERIDASKEPKIVFQKVISLVSRLLR